MSHKPRHKRQQNKTRNKVSSRRQLISTEEGKKAERANTETTQTDEQTNTPQAPTPKPISTDKWMLAFTGAIAISTTVYVCCAGYQLQVMKGQLQQMRDTAQLEQRAWVGISNATHDPIEPNKPAKGEFQITNTGETPAFIISMGHTTAIGSPSLDVEDFANRREAQAWKTDTTIQRCLAPNSSVTMPFSTDVNMPLSKEIVASIDSRERRLCVVGKIVYQDIFGEEHQTQFCGIADPNTKRMTMHHKYNYMD